MNFLNAIKKGNHIRRKGDVKMWEKLGYKNFWFNVRNLKNVGLEYWGISIKDVLASDWEIK